MYSIMFYKQNSKFNMQKPFLIFITFPSQETCGYNCYPKPKQLHCRTVTMVIDGV